MQRLYDKQENLEKVNEKSADEEEKEMLQVCWSTQNVQVSSSFAQIELVKTM